MPKTRAKSKTAPRSPLAGTRYAGLKGPALLAALTPRQAHLMIAAGIDPCTGRWPGDHPAVALASHDPVVAAAVAAPSGSGDPAQPQLCDLIGLLYLPWAVGFLTGVAWEQISATVRELSDYTSSQEIMFADVALMPVTKWGGLQHDPNLPALHALCAQVGWTEPLHGWHGLALGLAALERAAPFRLEDGSPGYPYEFWLARVPQRTYDGQYWERAWFGPGGNPAAWTPETQAAYLAGLAALPPANVARLLGLPDLAGVLAAAAQLAGGE